MLFMMGMSVSVFVTFGLPLQPSRLNDP